MLCTHARWTHQNFIDNSQQKSFPGDSDCKEFACNAELGSIPELGRSPGEEKWLPTPIFLPGELHRQRSLVGYRPRGHKESDMTEWLAFSLHFFIFTPLSRSKWGRRFTVWHRIFWCCFSCLWGVLCWFSHATQLLLVIEIALLPAFPNGNGNFGDKVERTFDSQ